MRRNKKHTYEEARNSKMIDLACVKGCGRIVRVNEETSKVICFLCANKMTDPPEVREKKMEKQARKSRGFPQGWHLMKQFVDKDGNVYEFGIEKEDLKGKYEPTVVHKRKKRQKKSTFQKNLEDEEKEKQLAQEYKEKETNV